MLAAAAARRAAPEAGTSGSGGESRGQCAEGEAGDEPRRQKRPGRAAKTKGLRRVRAEASGETRRVSWAVQKPVITKRDLGG
nr:unnamed protein product [Digitaria exilis]